MTTPLVPCDPRGFECKCTLCGLLVGYTRQPGETEIHCLFCTDEADHFLWQFSGLHQTDDMDRYYKLWDSFTRFKGYEDRTFYLHQRREHELKEMQDYFRDLWQELRKK